MPELPSGTVAFLFTDIEGSTKRWDRDSAAMWSAVERHFAILDAAIEVSRGVRFKTIGDAVQAAFPTVPRAVAAALAAQRALITEPWGGPGPLHVRMAIHAGEAEPRDGDYLAPALNRLARLMSAGHGGQVLLTVAAANLARDTLPAGASLRDLGEHRLRDLQRPEPVFQLIHPDLPADFPPLKSLDMPRHNLPIPATPFIGREADVERVVALLQQPDTRLVTLTGPGGIGKTRLALQSAERLLEAFPHGIWFVDLAALDDAALVPRAIARALSVPEEGGRSLLDVLREHLAARSLLLVLDNFEQLLDAAPMVSTLLGASPGSRALATSRAPLRLRGEREVDLAPLSLPPPRSAEGQTPEAMARSEAVQLFLARAEAVKPGFALTAETAPAVAEICRRLDGLPLAIELAAARLRMLPPRELLNRLDDRLRLLTGGPRDAPARHQTLRQTIAWSHDLLAPDEQTLFRRMAVFAGQPTLAAIEAVTDPDGSLDAFEALASLVEQSLLQQRGDGEAEPRFGMLQTIRDFAREQLAVHGETDSIASARAHYFARFAEDAHPELFGPEQAAWFERFASDHDDLRGALHWLIERHETDAALRLAGTLTTFWLIRGYPSEGSELLDRALQDSANADPGVRCHALVSAGMLAGAQGETEHAAALLEEALALAEASGDDAATARVLAALAVNAEDRGDFARAVELHEEALVLYRATNDQHAIGQELVGLGTLAASTGQNERAALLLEEATAHFRALGDDWGLGHGLLNLGRLAFLDGRLDRATARSEEALAIFRALDDTASSALLLANLGEVAFHQGMLERALSLYNQALADFRDLGDKRNIAATTMTQAEALAARDNAAAGELLRESLLLAREIDDKEGIVRGLEVLASLLIRGDAPCAVQAISLADALRARLGAALPVVYRPERERILAAARSRLGDDAFGQAWSAGQARSIDEAVETGLALANRVAGA